MNESGFNPHRGCLSTYQNENKKNRVRKQSFNPHRGCLSTYIMNNPIIQLELL